MKLKDFPELYDAEDSDLRDSEPVLDFKDSKKGKILKINRFIGIEIEAERGNQIKAGQYINADIGITYDGSLQSGTEFRLPPRKMKQAEDIIKETCQILKLCNYKISDRCGLHVHVDFRDYADDLDKISEIFKVMHAVEPILYAYVKKSRSTNIYCVPLTRAYDYNDVDQKLIDSGVKDYFKSYKRYPEEMFNGKSAPSHYSGTNLTSIINRGTIEFRYHEGCLDYDEIIKWISILLHVVDYAINDFKESEVNKIQQLKGKKKLKTFFKVIKIDDKLQKHMINRINKNYPNFLKITKPIIEAIQALGGSV